MNAARFRSVLAAHVLRSLTQAQREGRRLSLPELSESLGVRRADVRSVLSALHHEGLVDVTRMRLTLQGFGLGSALATQRLAALRTIPAFRASTAA